MTYERKFQDCPWRTSSGECTNKNIPAHECKIKLKNCKTYKQWKKEIKTISNTITMPTETSELWGHDE